MVIKHIQSVQGLLDRPAVCGPNTFSKSRFSDCAGSSGSKMTKQWQCRTPQLILRTLKKHWEPAAVLFRVSGPLRKDEPHYHAYVIKGDCTAGLFASITERKWRTITQIIVKLNPVIKARLSSLSFFKIFELFMHIFCIRLQA